MKPIRLVSYTMTSCLGRGLEPARAALRAGTTGLAPCRFETVALDTFAGEIVGLDEQAIPGALARFDCRNNRAAELGLVQDGFADEVARVAAQVGPGRVGTFMGTSTAGILQTELAYRRRGPQGELPADFHYRTTHNTFSIAEYVRERLGLAGPCAAISTACSSSAKAFATAARLIEAGVIEAAVVGGVDTFCLTTLYGFNSLQLLSNEPCRPWDAARQGISIGEGAAFILLQRSEGGDGTMHLLGAGESCDAHHMSAPHPEGLGARLAMQAALDAAGLEAAAIDYVNLHGTGTPSNDASEDQAVVGLFGEHVPASSTKGMTGHTLGAAGAIEALITVLALEEGRIPGSPGTRILDPKLRAGYAIRGREAPLARALSNSFGFGGSNCSLVFGRA